MQQYNNNLNGRGQSFKSQAELGFYPPPIQTRAAHQPATQQRYPAPPPLRAHAPSQSMPYPYPPPAQPQYVNRSASSSPTRRPLPAPAPAQLPSVPVYHQPPMNGARFPIQQSKHQSIDLSAFQRFNQERFSGRSNINPVKDQPLAPPRRRASPPRFFPAAPTTTSSPATSNRSRSTSPTKPSPYPTSSYPVAQATPPSSYTHSFIQQTPIQSRTPHNSYNPILDPPSPTSTSSPGDTKFVPLWKRSSIARGRPTSTIETTSVPNRAAPNGSSLVNGKRPLPTPGQPTDPNRGNPPTRNPSPTRTGPQATKRLPNHGEEEQDRASPVLNGFPRGKYPSSPASSAPPSPQYGILDLPSRTNSQITTKPTHSLPQPPTMASGKPAQSLPPSFNTPFASGSGANSGMPNPPEMTRGRAATASGVGDTGASMTLRFAKMDLEEENRNGKGAWPQDLPRLPKAPGSSFTSFSGSDSSAFSNRSTFSREPSRPRSGFSTRAEEITLADLDEPPPRPASASFSLRSSSPAESVASGVSRVSGISGVSGTSTSSTMSRGAFDRFRQTAAERSAGGGSRFTYDEEEEDQYDLPRQPELERFSKAGEPQTPRQRQHRQQAQTPVLNIESPAPLGGRERTADMKRMEDDSRSQAMNLSQRPASRPGSRPGTAPPIPRIAISGMGDEDGDEGDGPTGIPSIAISVSESEERKQPGPPPPQIVFEVPGMGMDSQFGGSGGPVISVSGMDDDDHNVNDTQPHRHQRKPAPPTVSAPSRFDQPRRPGGLTCPACAKPIIGRIVGAMGMKWHPDCFRCSVCGELLECVSSYEGPDGRAYCHLDYHEAFAPRCYHCKTPIVEERFISLDDNALGKRTYHEQHFFCSECGDPFLSPSSSLPHNKHHQPGGGGAGSGEMSFSGDGTFVGGEDDVGFTVYKGYPYCEACHVRLRLPKCRKCKKPIRDHMEAVEALGGKWCWECFCCAGCERPFEEPSFFERDKKPYCESCFSIMIRNEL